MKVVQVNLVILDNPYWNANSPFNFIDTLNTIMFITKSNEFFLLLEKPPKITEQVSALTRFKCIAYQETLAT